MTRSIRTAVLSCAIAGAYVGVASHRASAQSAVRGRVTMADGATRASGVIVVANPADGIPAAVTRALTSQRGEYQIALPRAGRYQIQALRIGFRPTAGPIINVAAADTVVANIQLTDVAVSLTTVTVRGDDVCRTSPDSGALVARAWEEARKAIMASQLSTNEAPLVAEWIEYQRTFDPTGRIIRAQTVRTTRSPTTHAFKSAPAAMLAERGFVTLDSGETTFHAPDGDVLLSDSFAAMHCFQIVQPERGADTLIGVGFRPAVDVRDFRGIDGTFWLDKRTSELRWLDYRYLNLPAAADRAQPGGRVEFLHIGTGGWLIGRWHIRMPELVRTVVGQSTSGARTVRAPPGGSLRAIQVTGGEVARVARGETAVYELAGAALDVQFVERDRIATAAGGTVELLGTDYVARVGSGGRARLTPVLTGRYEARIRTALMDTLGVAPITREIEIVRGAARDTVRLASADELLRATCRDSAGAGTSLVRGSVRTPTGEAVPNAAVVVAWQGQFKIFVQGNSDRVSAVEETVGAFSDAAGKWRVCGVPREIPVVVRVKTDEGADQVRVRLQETESIRAVDLVPRPVTATIDIVLPKTNRALVELSVSNDAGAMLSGTTLEVELPGGGTRSFTTTASGLALIPDVAVGKLTVRARKIGYLPGQISATIAAGRNTVPIILSNMALPTLDTVRIIGDERKRNDRLDEFDTRRLNGSATRSIARDEIVKRNPVDTWQMMTNISSVRVARQAGLVIARSTRVENARLLSDKPCYLRAMVDGVLLPEDADLEGGGKATNLANLPRPEEIHGIEIFAGPASIPVQYGGGGSNKWCGLIAVWTR